LRGRVAGSLACMHTPCSLLGPRLRRRNNSYCSGTSDGNIKYINLRRSSDAGASWTPLQVTGRVRAWATRPDRVHSSGVVRRRCTPAPRWTSWRRCTCRPPVRSFCCCRCVRLGAVAPTMAHPTSTACPAGLREYFWRSACLRRPEMHNRLALFPRIPPTQCGGRSRQPYVEGRPCCAL
jgi:hypothetical protein